MLIWSSLAAALVGVLLYVRARDQGRLQRLALALLPWLATVSCLQLAHVWLGTPWDHWNASRLAPAIGMLHGHELYASREAGSIQSTMYPPGFYVAYLPAGLARSPTWAILMASAMTFFLVTCGPFAAFLLTAGRKRTSWALLGCATFLMFGLLFLPVQRHLAMVHVDAPALCFASLGCLFVFAHRRGRDASLVAAAACVCLAIWCKQTMLPVAAVLPLVVGWLHGRRAMARLASAELALGLVLLGVTLLLASPGALVFQTIAIPSAFGFKPGSVASAVQLFLEHGWPSLLACALALALILPGARRTPGPRLRQLAVSNPGVIFIVVGLALTPGSLLGQAKHGGGPNSYHNLYFVQCATVCMLLGGAREALPTGAVGRLAHACRAALLVAPAGLAALLTHSLVGVSLQSEFERLYDNPQQVAYEYSLRHPGQTLFPWNPLSSLMAEGRLDHQDKAVQDWRLAGEKVDAERLLESIPPSITSIAYPPHLPRVRRNVAWILGQRRWDTVPELPEWRVYDLPLRKPLSRLEAGALHD